MFTVNPALNEIVLNRAYIFFGSVKLWAPVFLLFFLSSCKPNRGSGEPLESSPSPSAESFVFYVDPDGGLDTNQGTSPQNPWQSLEQVNSFPFPEGSSVLLKRGGVWYETLHIPISDFSVGAFGKGPAPVIDGSVEVKGWSSLGNNIYKKKINVNSDQGLGNVSKDGKLLSFVPWVNTISETFRNAPFDSFSYIYATNEMFIYVNENPTLHDFRASRLLYGVRAENKNDITINDLLIQRFSLGGISLSKCRDFNISGITVEKGGGTIVGSNTNGKPNFLYAGNGIAINNQSSNGTIQDVIIDQVFDSGISPQTFQSDQEIKNIHIKDFQISNCGFAGIELSVLSNGGSQGSSLHRVEITNGSIIQSGMGWSGRRYGREGHGVRVGVDLNAGQMDGIRINQTEISTSSSDGIQIFGEAGEVSLEQCTISNNRNAGIQVLDPVARGIGLQLVSSLIFNNKNHGLAVNAPRSAGIKVFHNTFFNNDGINLGVYSDLGSSKIKNNIFYSSSPMTHFFAAGSMTSLEMDHNCYNDQSNMIGYDSNSYSSVNQFRAATSFEGNGYGQGLVALVNPAIGNFELQSTSACIGMGNSNVGVVADHVGVPFHSPPSSGAYEFIK